MASKSCRCISGGADSIVIWDQRGALSPLTLDSTACRRLPDAALLHTSDLSVDHLLLVLGMPAGNFFEIEVLRIDRLLVDDLGQLGTDVLGPVRYLRRLAMMPQRLDVDYPGDEGRAVRVALLADNRTAIVDDHRLPAAGVDRGLAVGVEVIAANIRRDDIHVVLKRPRPVRDLEEVVLRKGRGKRGAIYHLGAVEGEATAVLGIVAFHRHHDPEASDRGVGDRPEGLQGAAVFLDPPVEEIVRGDRALARQQ